MLEKICGLLVLMVTLKVLFSPITYYYVHDILSSLLVTHMLIDYLTSKILKKKLRLMALMLVTSLSLIDALLVLPSS